MPTNPNPAEMRCVARRRPAVPGLRSRVGTVHRPRPRHAGGEARGSVKGGENRRRPPASEIFRERVEAELGDWLRPYNAARDSGDHALALKAADSILDRAYGRARQATELSGPDGGAITIEQLAVKMLSEVLRGAGSGDEALALKAADSILDRAYGGRGRRPN
jgi:hypothetical protein